MAVQADYATLQYVMLLLSTTSYDVDCDARSIEAFGKVGWGRRSGK